MTAPEFGPAVMREVQQDEKEYFTVQHKFPGVTGWPQEIPAVATPGEAIATLEAHAHWYQPGDIRAVKKIVRTTVEVYTIDLSAVTQA